MRPPGHRPAPPAHYFTHIKQHNYWVRAERAQIGPTFRLVKPDRFDTVRMCAETRRQFYFSQLSLDAPYDVHGSAPSDWCACGLEQASLAIRTERRSPPPPGSGVPKYCSMGIYADGRSHFTVANTEMRRKSVGAPGRAPLHLQVQQQRSEMAARPWSKKH